MVAWTITESEFHSAQSIFQANLPCHITWNGATTTKKTQGKRILVRTPKNSRRRAPTRGGGHPQGAPLPIVFSRRYALGRAPTRGAPTDCLLSALCPWGGHPQGAPLPIVFSRRYALGRAPTRGAPTNCFLSALCPGEGTHRWRPYQLSSLGAMPWGGRPQGAPLPIRYALGRAPTRGAPTDSLCPGEGPHKGRLYRLSSLGVMPWGGHPQGAPLPILFSRRFALGRAPTRGAPTYSLCPGEGAH